MVAEITLPSLPDQEITRNVVGGVKSVNFLFGVESHRERITHLFPESGDRFAGFAARYGQENEVFVPLEAVDDVLLYAAQFLAAGTAPGRPEIQKHHFAAQTAQGEGRAVEHFHPEIGCLCPGFNKGRSLDVVGRIVRILGLFGLRSVRCGGCGLRSVGQQPHQGDDDREQDDHQDKTFVIGFFTFGHSDIIGFQSLTSVPIFSPASTFSRLPGVSMSKTMTRRPFSRQSVKAVISITFRLRR